MVNSAHSLPEIGRGGRGFAAEEASMTFDEHLGMQFEEGEGGHLELSLPAAGGVRAELRVPIPRATAPYFSLARERPSGIQGTPGG